MAYKTSIDLAERYCAAQPFLRKLRVLRNRLTAQEANTLKGQALAGDVEGAERGLMKAIGRMDYVER